MRARHLVLGGVPATLIIGVVAVLTRHHVHLTMDEAMYVGATALAAGTGIAHRIELVGLKGFFSGIWNGPAAPPTK